MVNRGRSQGCTTCKQRRVKCDEAKPDCGVCRRLHLACSYRDRPRRFKFRDQTHKYGRVPGPPLPLSVDVAVPFYLGHYASIGRHAESARGFFEVLVPVYSAERHDSALSLAVAAVASTTLGLWRHGPASLKLPSSKTAYSQAVAGLRRAVQDPVEQARPGTVMAILTLQWYENIEAIYAHRPASPTHHSGALSLLELVDAGSASTDKTIASLQRFIAHAEVSSAMRQKRPIHGAISSWMARGSLLKGNPSSALDNIGAAIADLQARYANKQASSRVTLEYFAREAEVIHMELLIWSWNIPEHWQPVRRIQGQHFDASIPAYQSACDIYPSSQIANIWNQWRAYRLVLVVIMLELQTPSRTAAPAGEGYEQTFQDLVDEICHSVPFFLGNRTRLMSIADFGDSSLLLCGCSGPHLDSLGESTLEWTCSEYRRHIIAQGPWHIMSPLSRLLVLLEQDCSGKLTALMRPGQHEWIREQFLRVAGLLRLLPSDIQGGVKRKTNVKGMKSVGRAQHIAEVFRRGAMFMSGP